MTINDMYISNCLCTTTTTTTTATKLLLQHYYTIYYYATTTLLPLPLPLSLLATITATATAIAHSWCERIWVPGLKIVFLALPSEVPSGGNKATSTKNPPAFLRHWVEKFSHFFFLKKYTWREDLRNFWTSVSVLVGSYNFETDDWQKRLKTRCLLYFDFEHQHGKNSMFFFFFFVALLTLAKMSKHTILAATRKRTRCFCLISKWQACSHKTHEVLEHFEVKGCKHRHFFNCFPPLS